MKLRPRGERLLETSSLPDIKGTERSGKSPGRCKRSLGRQRRFERERGKRLGCKERGNSTFEECSEGFIETMGRHRGKMTQT